MWGKAETLWAGAISNEEEIISFFVDTAGHLSQTFFPVSNNRCLIANGERIKINNYHAQRKG